MLYSIRWSTFETNSSATHSLAVMPKAKYLKWKHDGLYYCRDTYGWYYNIPNQKLPKVGELYTEEEVLAMFNDIPKYKEELEKLREFCEDDDDYEYEKEDFFKEEGFVTFEGWNSDDSYLEEDEHEFTTESGEEYVIRCKYGEDR